MSAPASKAVVSGVSLLLSLAAVELVLRAATPYPISEDSNRRADARLGYVLDPALPDVDEHGFRNPEGSALAQAEIVVLGDSHAYGNNVESGDSFPAVLGRLLSKRVYNMGVGSYGVYHYFLELDDLATLPSPVPVVLVALYPANDLALHCSVTRLASFEALANAAGVRAPACPPEEPRPRRDLATWLRESSALAGALAALGPDAEVPAFELPAGQRVPIERAETHAQATDLSDASNQLAFDSSLAIFAAARARLEANGTRLAVLFIPSRERVLATWAREEGNALDPRLESAVAGEIALTRRYALAFGEQRIAHLDAAPAVVAALREAIREGEALYPAGDDGHPFAAGYAAYAHAAADLLARL